MLQAGSRIGRYVVKRKLAEGGMAEIFLCTQEGPEGFEKEVVIKRIRAFLSQDPSFIEMFKAEARLVSRLNHANIVQIFDFARDDDTWFIAMEFVSGLSLWELRKKCRDIALPFSPTLAAEICAQIARGLHYAHSFSDKGTPMQVVHRDVTPHNVLLSHDGAVKLTDFGIAKAGTSVTSPGMLKGKFAYMSPEQGRGEPVDARTDVFALGIVLWEMLTGGRLFEGDSDVAVLRAVQESQIAPPSRLNPAVPPALDAVVSRALARPIAERFQSAQEFERALAQFVLTHAKTVEDTNVGLFIAKAFATVSSPEVPGAELGTGFAADGYAVGSTVRSDRSGELEPVQATPFPRPKTEQMPGLRSSRPLPTLDDSDGSEHRTDEMQELAASNKTAHQPGLRRSGRSLPEVGAPASVEVRASQVLEPIAPSVSEVETRLKKSEPRLEEVARAQGKTARRSPYTVLIAGMLLLVGGVAGAMWLNRGEPALPPVVPAQAQAENLPTQQEVVREQPPVVLEPAAPSMAPVALVDAPPQEQREEARPVPDAPRHEKAEKAREVTQGVLVIDAVPWANVFIDNRKCCEVVGQKKLALPAGTHNLRFEHPKKTESATVTIEPRKPASAVFRALQ